MSLSKKQKKYIKKHLKKKSLEKIASDLKINQKIIKKHLQERWGKLKYQKFVKHNRFVPNNNFKKRVSRFNFKTFFKSNWSILVFLIILIFVVYTNSLANEFVSDDVAGVLYNDNLNNFSYILSSPLHLMRFFQTGSHVIINLIFGKSPVAFHLLNIFFHIAATLVTYMVIFLLASQTTALLTASIMAVHPINTESVAWISGVGHVMYSFFLMLSLLFYILTIKKKQFLLPAIIAFFLALSISEKAIIFPLILFVFTISYKIKPKNWKKITLMTLIPVFIVGFVFLRKIPERMSWLQTTHYQDGGLTNPVWQIPIAITSYLELIFWPKNLTLYHSEMMFSQNEYLSRLAIFITFLGIIIWLFNRRRDIFFWLSFFTISLLPTLTPFGVSWIVAERYVYFGAIGLFVIMALGFKKAMEIKKLQPVVIIIFTGLIIALSIRTIIRNADWKNQDTLWLATAKISPSSSQNHNNLGDLYGRRGDFQKSIEEFKIAIELKPGYADAYHNLANTYQQLEQNDLAIENYQKALEFNPNLWQSHLNLGIIYLKQEKKDAAKKEFQQVLQINPEFPLQERIPIDTPGILE